jgi:hypothetical protein
MDEGVSGSFDGCNRIAREHGHPRTRSMFAPISHDFARPARVWGIGRAGLKLVRFLVSRGMNSRNLILSDGRLGRRLDGGMRFIENIKFDLRPRTLREAWNSHGRCRGFLDKRKRSEASIVRL